MAGVKKVTFEPRARNQYRMRVDGELVPGKPFGKSQKERVLGMLMRMLEHGGAMSISLSKPTARPPSKAPTGTKHPSKYRSKQR